MRRTFWLTLVLLLAHALSAAAQTGPIRANNGFYVCAELGGGLSGRPDVLIANRPAAAGWEMFTRVPAGDGWFYLKTFNGNYVEAVNGGGGGLTTTNRSQGEWGRFRLALDGSIVTANGRHRLTVRTDLGAPFVDATGVLPGATFRFE